MSGHDDKERDSQLREYHDPELAKLMSSCQLPTVEAVQLASFEIKPTTFNNEEPKRREKTLEAVPSHIVPPRNAPQVPER